MSFYTDVIRQDIRFSSPSLIHDMALLEPGTRAGVIGIIFDAKTEYGIDLMAFETFRSEARQQELYKLGKTRLWKVGCHGYGVACDLAKVVNGQPSWEGDYTFLIPLAKKHGLISGIDWGRPDESHSFVDSDHVQRVPLWRQYTLFDGTWYPPETYDPYTDVET